MVHVPAQVRINAGKEFYPLFSFLSTLLYVLFSFCFSLNVDGTRVYNIISTQTTQTNVGTSSQQIQPGQQTNKLMENEDMESNSSSEDEQVLPSGKIVSGGKRSILRQKRKLKALLMY